jgi:hypothetical protein
MLLRRLSKERENLLSRRAEGRGARGRQAKTQ